MSKNVREQTHNPKTETSGRTIIPQKYQHPVAIAIIYLSLLLFFHAVIFEGKTYLSADSMASHSWDTFRKDSDANGIIPLWNPYIFCGMPGVASLTYPIQRIYDISSLIWESVGQRTLLFLFFNESQSGPWLIFYLIYGIGVYLFVYHLLKNKMIALIVSLMAVYATYVTLLIMMGHVTKLVVLSWFPYVFLLVDQLRQKFKLLLAIILPIIIRLLIQPGHVQYIFYVYLALGIYFLFFLIRAALKKEPWRGVITSGITLVLATGIAFLMGADLHFSTWEYNPYSMRGANPIQSSISNSQSKTISGGLDYDYATDYSFSPGEVMTFFIPSWYGFGPLTYQGPLTQNHPTRLYLYWGRMPIVDGPQYMGVTVIILALIGLYRLRKEPLVQYLGIVIGFALLVSFGREFPLVYDLMYRYFPMFNKFRVPVLILMLLQFCIPILAGYGILSFLSLTKKGVNPVRQKHWKYLLLGLFGALIITLIGKDFIKEIYSSFFPLQEIGKAFVRSYGQLNPAVVSMMFDFVFSSVYTDILVFLILTIILIGAFWYYQKGNLKIQTLYGILIILVLFDLWRVAAKTSDPKDRQETEQYFTTPEYVKIIQQDTTQFRVLRFMNGQPTYDNSLAYWNLHSAYGYHGAKMRTYQDMVDVAHIGNPLVWQLMNVKYILTDKPDSSSMLVPIYQSNGMNVYAFRYGLPHTFFVRRYEVADGINTLNHIAALSFDPRDIAYVPEQIQATIDPPREAAKVTITRYGTQELEIQATATGNNLLFLSEVYYPKGWKAYIDGKEAEILKLNYLFRGVVIPQGMHSLTMRFEPSSFSLGKEISLTSNILVFGGLIASIVRLIQQRRKLKKQSG
jgi:hypothetical protein